MANSRLETEISSKKWPIQEFIQNVRNTTEGIVAQVEPLLIDRETSIRAGIQPFELRFEILHWRDPNIAGTVQFMDMLEMTAPDVNRYVLQKSKGQYLKNLKEHFDEESGGFTEVKSTAKKKMSYPSLSATNNAVGVMRYLVGVGKEERLGYANAADLLGKETTNRLITFATDSQDLTSGGFFMNPESKGLKGARQSIWNTHKAVLILDNLDYKNAQITAGIIHFLSSYLRRIPNSLPPKWDGFMESQKMLPGEGVSSSATASALEILSLLGREDLIQKYQSTIVDFLKSCWSIDRDGGGYAYKPHDKPMLLYTNNVLSSLESLGVGIDDVIPGKSSREELIEFYRQQTKSKYPDKLMFGFVPGWSPNMYSMATTMRTLKSLGKRDEKFASLFYEIFLKNQPRTVRGIYHYVRGKWFLEDFFVI